MSCSHTLHIGLVLVHRSFAFPKIENEVEGAGNQCQQQLKKIIKQLLSFVRCGCMLLKAAEMSNSKLCCNGHFCEYIAKNVPRNYLPLSKGYASWGGGGL